MAARPHKHRMKRDEALAEIFADQDSDVSDFSDIEFKSSVSESLKRRRKKMKANKMKVVKKQIKVNLKMHVELCYATVE